jgi:outer membrane protein
MRSLVVAVLLAAIFSFHTTSYAKSNSNGFKVGYVDFQEALNSVDEGKQAKARLKREHENKQKELQSLQGKLKKMKEELDKKRMILSADALREKEGEFRKEFMGLQEKTNKYTMDLQTKEAESTNRILRVLKGLISDIGRKEGYSMILEKSQDVVIYSKDDADLTSRIIGMYNSLPKSKKK